jgi:phenylalanyl-tRNA synthetase beta chain
MKVSLNWLREFLDIHKTPAEIDDILTSLGLEVEGFEEVRPSPVDLDQVLVGRVLTCERIPDTDHLSATTVEVLVKGEKKVQSIVCGAPNVAAGQTVMVAMPGANVFSKDGSLFTIGERKVRGIMSQGMICAEDELGIGHDHSGIMVLPDHIPLGTTAAQYFNKDSDTVFEVGLTPNRADATSHRGVALDLLAWTRHHENPAAQLRPLDLSAFVPKGTAPVQVRVENSGACPRYTGVSITGLKIQESPEWLQQRLLAVGLRPINNVVDVTNYVRAELGQPLHAFDLEKIGGQQVVVKTLPAGTIFLALDGTERKLTEHDLMICDGHDQPMSIGGVFGGLNSGVSDATTAIFLESACFDARWIRRSMLHHSLRTDAAWTFEKGVDANATLVALQRAALLIVELAGGTITGEVTDWYPAPVQSARVPMLYERINSLIGEKISPETVKNILTALEIGMENSTAEGFTAVIPTNKPEVTREADVVEEILRVYGLDTVAMPQSIRSSMEITPKPDPNALRNQMSDLLSAQGFYECMSLSLSNSEHYTGEKALLPRDAASLVRVYNTANQGLDCLRPSLVPALLEAVRFNQNRRHADLRLYEFGNVYERTAQDIPADDRSVKQFRETMQLGVLLTGAYSPEGWQASAKKQVDFYTLKAQVDHLLARMGIGGFQETAFSAEGPFQFALRYHRGPQELVTLGKIHPALAKNFDVKNEVFYAEFQFEACLKVSGQAKIMYAEVSKFPAVRRDLALVLNRQVTFGEIRQLAQKTVKKALKSVNLFDVFDDESKLGAGKKSYAVSFIFEDHEKTLKDTEIDAWMGQLQGAFEQKLAAIIRK